MAPPDRPTTSALLKSMKLDARFDAMLAAAALIADGPLMTEHERAALRAQIDGGRPGIATTPPDRAQERRAEPILLTARSAAVLLGISVDSLRAMDLPRVRLPGGRARYSRHDIEGLRGCQSDADPTTAAGCSTSASAASATARRSARNATTSASARLRPWNASGGKRSRRAASDPATAGARLRLVTGSSTGST